MKLRGICIHEKKRKNRLCRDSTKEFKAMGNSNGFFRIQDARTTFCTVPRAVTTDRPSSLLPAYIFRKFKGYLITSISLDFPTSPLVSPSSIHLSLNISRVPRGRNQVAVACLDVHPTLISITVCRPVDFADRALFSPVPSSTSRHIAIMATSPEANGGLTPRSFATKHQRPRSSFTGCSRITDYELLGKLGEGTFG